MKVSVMQCKKPEFCMIQDPNAAARDAVIAEVAG